MSDENKDLLLSKTAILSVLSIASVVAEMLGYEFGDVDGWANELSALIFSISAIWGRAVGVKRITSVAGIPITKESK